jgi:hypothetical protein
MPHLRITRRHLFPLGLAAALGASAQTPAMPEMQGLPPRASAADYSAQEKVGDITIGADFVGHAVPTMQGPLTSEDYVAVELAFYGPANAKARISFQDFSLRINEKKSTLPSQQYGMVMKSLSDPEWIPPVVEGEKSKGGGISAGGGGGGAAGDPKPAPPKMPFPLRRAMEQKAQKSALPEGERLLPVAGLVFFAYRGKDQGIQQVELLYNGAAGKTTLSLRR